MSDFLKFLAAPLVAPLAPLLPLLKPHQADQPAAPAGGAAPAAAPPAGDQNLAAPAAAWQGTDDVSIEETKLETLGAAVRKAVQNDGSIDPKERKFIEDLTNFLWPKGGAAPGGAGPAGGAGPTTSTPAANSWPVGADKLTDADGKTFSSTGDPHETTGDAQHFDNMASGTFIKAKSASGDFELQATQGKDATGRWPGATLNQKASIKSGKDVVAYDGLTKELKVNGQKVDVASLPKTLADGGKVEKTADGIKVTTGKNDVVEIHQRDAYIDITGKVGDRADGEVRGSLGAFDKGTDGGNDLLGRTGNTPMADKNAFIEEWRVKPGEDLNEANPGGGAGPKDAIDQEFDKLDKTGEGYLSGNEITPELKAAFPGKDRITRDEFRAFRAGQADAAAEAAAVAQDEADFAKADITGDGWLSGTEAKGAEQYDKGGNYKGKDGQEIKEITKEEFMAGRKAERAAKKAAAPGGAGPAGGAGPVAPGTPDAIKDKAFTAVIKDFKGKIADAEVKVDRAEAKLKSAHGIFGRIRAMSALNKAKKEAAATVAKAQDVLRGAATVKGLDAEKIVADETARGKLQGAQQYAKEAADAAKAADVNPVKAFFMPHTLINQLDKQAEADDAAAKLGKATLAAPVGADPFDDINVDVAVPAPGGAAK